MSDTYDYSPWRRQLADIAEDDPRKVNPCPKALRRAADALVQKQTVIDEMLESLDEAKFTEPELRAKLDKQRQRIDQLEMALRRLHSLPAHDYCDTLAGFAGAVRTIAYDALETAGGSGKCDCKYCHGDRITDGVGFGCTCTPECKAETDGDNGNG